MTKKKASPASLSKDDEMEQFKSASDSLSDAATIESFLVGKTTGGSIVGKESTKDVSCQAEAPKMIASPESMGSNWSFETLAQAKSCERTPVPYSDLTKRQIELIKTLVEQQEKETEARLAREAAGVTETEGKDSGREPTSEMSTTFGQAMDLIHGQIRRAHEKRDRQWEREKAKGKKKDDGDDKDKWNRNKLDASLAVHQNFHFFILNSTIFIFFFRDIKVTLNFNLKS